MYTILKNNQEIYSSNSLQVMVDLQKHFQEWDEVEATCLNLSSAVFKLKRLQGFQMFPELAEELKEFEDFVAEEYDSIAKSDNPQDLGEFIYTIQFHEDY